VKAIRAGKLKPSQIAEEDRDYYLERRYPAFGNLVPRDVASRAAKERCDAGYGVNETGLAVYLDFKTAIERLGKDIIKQRYGNLFDMYEEITDVSPYEQPMQIFPAVHYTMGGIWVDYNLMTTIPGLYAIGEANFSDHGANRLGASADAGSCRRLLRAALHHRRLPLAQDPGPEGEDRHQGLRRGREGRQGEDRQTPRDQRQAVGGRHPQESWATSCGRTSAWPVRKSPSKRPSPRFRPCARSSGRT